jgi:hypothetical protein
MFKLGLGLQGYTPSAIAFDSDAAAFFATAGVTDATAKSQINDFVKGVKSLGLYNNMVCWPLRSSQNAGTGTTAYSLGGLGTFNGTLVSGPTWGVDGVTFNGSSSYISTGITFNYNTASMLFAAVNRAVTQTNPRIFGTGDVANGPFFYRAVGSVAGAFNGTSYSTFTIPSNNTWNIVSQAFGASTLRGAINQSAVSTSYTPVASTQSLQIAAGQSAANYWNGAMAIAGYLADEVSEANQLALHTLYKTTLGQGLGLP